jgi:hypothetical protein
MVLYANVRKQNLPRSGYFFFLFTALKLTCLQITQILVTVPATIVFCDAETTAVVNNFSALRDFYGSNNLHLSSYNRHCKANIDITTTMKANTRQRVC